jgi:hypothetical protein
LRGAPNLELVWSDGAFQGGASDVRALARGLIWSCGPVHCAGSVSVHHGEYTISTAGWRGLTDVELEAVEKHLESMGLTKWKRE